MFVHLTGPGMRLRCRVFGGRLLAVLALVLPVPVLAVLGLSLPLPATVERIAARLVPFGNLEKGSGAVAIGGTIVLVPGEQRSEGMPTESDGSLAAVTRGAALPGAAIAGPRGTSPSAETAAGAAVPVGEARGTTLADDARTSSTPSNSTPSNSTPSNSTPSEATPPAPTPGGTQSGGGSEPAEPSLVDTATTTAGGAVNTATTAVTDAATPPVETAKGVVESADDGAKDVLGALKP